MKNKIHVVAFALMFAAMMIAPVLAKPNSRGPLNSAGKNPNADLGWSTPPSYPDDPLAAKLDLMTPSGLINRWINYTDNTSRVVMKPDNKFKIKTAVEAIGWFSPFMPANIGKWVHMSLAQLQALSEQFGSDAPDIGGADGVYFKYTSLEK